MFRIVLKLGNVSMRIVSLRKRPMHVPYQMITDWYMLYVSLTVLQSSARVSERNVDYLRRQNELLLMPYTLFLETLRATKLDL